MPEPGILAVPPSLPGDRLVEKRTFVVSVHTRARYVRLHAEPLGTIPDWHAAAGKTAWLFADELIVR